MKTPILINGAGPTGLVLALSLTKNGIPVRILEKELKPRLGERGSGISHRTFEVLRLLGVYEDVMNASIPVRLQRVHDPADPTKVLKTFHVSPPQESTPNKPYLHSRLLGQHIHERILRDHLTTLGVPVEFGSELRSFTQTDEEVHVEILKHAESDHGEDTIENATFSYLVGADGAHSAVRKALGLQFDGESLGDFGVVGDIKVTRPPEFWEAWGSHHTKILYIRTTADPTVASFIVAGPELTATLDEATTDRDRLVEVFKSISGPTEFDYGELVRSSRYKPNIRMVKDMQSGRVFIAGDAAHCHSPAGGQGLNSSIQDAFNLGWKLALVYEGLAPPSLLSTYSEERIPIIAEMLGKTSTLFKKIISEGNELGTRTGAHGFGQLGVNYRGSSLILKGASAESALDDTALEHPGYRAASVDAAQPGDRAPQAPALIEVGSKVKTDLFSIFTPTKHTVLVFGSVDADYGEIFDAMKVAPQGRVQTILVLHEAGKKNSKFPYDKQVIDSQRHAARGYHVEDTSETEVVIVRPDGYIGARGTTTSSIVGPYFKRIFV